MSSRSTLGFVAVLSALFASSSAADPAPPFAEEAFRDLLDAIEARAMDEFVAFGDEGFKAMPKSEFESLAAKFAPMLSSGYRAAFVAVFRQKDSTVYYWKASPVAEAGPPNKRLQLTAAVGGVRWPWPAAVGPGVGPLVGVRTLLRWCTRGRS